MATKQLDDEYPDQSSGARTQIRRPPHLPQVDHLYFSIRISRSPSEPKFARKD